MLGKSPLPQTNLFLPHLSSFIDMNYELVLLAHQIDWKYFEDAFKLYYSNVGQPSIPVMLSSLIKAYFLKLCTE